MRIIISAVIFLFGIQACPADLESSKKEKPGSIHHEVSDDSKKLEPFSNEGNNIKRLVLLSEFKVGTHSYFLELDSDNFDFPWYFGLDGEDLILVNGLEKKIVWLNVNTGKSTTDEKLNSVYSDYDIKYKGFNNLVVYQEYYFISFLRGIICVSKNGKLISEIPINTNISYFTIMKNGTLVICTGTEIVYVKQGSSSPQKYDFENTISEVSVTQSDIIYDVLYNKIEAYDLNKILQGGTPEEIWLNMVFLKEDYQALHTATSDYLIWLNIKDKNKLILLDRLTYGNREQMRINIDNEVLLKNDSPLEDEKDGIRIVAKSNELFYFLVMKNKTIQVYILRF